MPKKILLIENDPAYGDRVSPSLEATGFEVRVTGDGKEGLDLARDWAPEAIVLCVELPGMSGYLVCQKLKKDEALKAIPLVLTSAEATEETFEKHRTLKARADEYLLKPYEPEALVATLGALIGLPEGAEATAADEGEEELVSLEEEMGLDAAEGEPEAEVPGLDLQSLPDEPGAAPGASVDEDLRLLDDAFDGLSEPPAAVDAAAALDELTGETPVEGSDVDAAAASLPEEDEGAARAALGGLEDEADAALGALGGADEALAPVAAPEPVRAPPAAARPHGASADLLRAAGIRLLDEDVAPGPANVAIAPPPPSADSGADSGADPAEIARLEGELADARETLERTQSDLAARDADLREVRRRMDELARRADDAETELGQARSRAEAAQEKARKAEADAKDARRAADGELADLRKRLTAAEKRAADAEAEARRKASEAAQAADAAAKAEALEREADELRTELLVARGEADGARSEIEKRTTELRKRVGELEGANAKNEERVVKAYQKIKADEKVRDKVRKALAIASQLLEEGLPPESAAEKERRAAAGAAAGRDERL